MDRISKVNKRVYMLPNCISNALWRGYSAERKPDGYVRALYFGSFTHAEDLAMIQPAIEAIQVRYPHFRLAVIGVQQDATSDWFERIAVPVHARNYSSFVPWLRQQAADFDLVLAPLMDTAFNLYKSGLKAMEGAALGCPVLASDVAPFREIAPALDGLTLVPNDIDAWTLALEKAIHQVEVDRSRRDAIKSKALQSFGLEQTIAEYDTLVLNILM